MGSGSGTPWGSGLLPGLMTPSCSLPAVGSAFQPRASGLRQQGRTKSLVPNTNGRERRAEAKISCNRLCNFCTCSIRPLDPAPSPSEEPARPTPLPASAPLTSSWRPRRAPRSQTPFQSRTAARRAVGSQRALQACRKLKEQKPTSLCFSHRPALWGCLSRGEGTHSPNSGAASARRSAAGAAPSVQNQFHVHLPGAAGEAAHLQRPPRTSRHAGLGSSRERETEPGVWRRNPVSRC